MSLPPEEGDALIASLQEQLKIALAAKAAHSITVKKNTSLAEKECIWDRISGDYPSIAGCCMCRRNTGGYRYYRKAGFVTCYSEECITSLKTICEDAGASLAECHVDDVPK